MCRISVYEGMYMLSHTFQCDQVCSKFIISMSPLLPNSTEEFQRRRPDPWSYEKARCHL